MLGWSCPGSESQVPRYATSPSRPLTQPREPELKYATVAVARSPAQRLMYPDCPYQDAWNPGVPVGTRAGGAMPGPTDPTQVAVIGLAGVTSGPAAASDAMSMITATTGAITRQLCALRAVTGTWRA